MTFILPERSYEAHNPKGLSGWVFKEGLLPKQEFLDTGIQYLNRYPDGDMAVAPVGLGLTVGFSSTGMMFILNGEHCSVTQTFRNNQYMDGIESSVFGVQAHSTIQTKTFNSMPGFCLAESVKFNKQVDCWCTDYEAFRDYGSEYSMRGVARILTEQIHTLEVCPLWIQYACVFDNTEILEVIREELMKVARKADEIISGEMYAAETMKELVMTNV